VSDIATSAAARAGVVAPVAAPLDDAIDALPTACFKEGGEAHQRPPEQYDIAFRRGHSDPNVLIDSNFLRCAGQTGQQLKEATRFVLAAVKSGSHMADFSYERPANPSNGPALLAVTLSSA